MADYRQNAQNEVAIFVQNAVLFFGGISCMIKPDNKGGKKLQAPRKVGPGECRWGSSQGTLRQRGYLTYEICVTRSNNVRERIP